MSPSHCSYCEGETARLQAFLARGPSAVVEGGSGIGKTALFEAALTDVEGPGE